MPFVRFRGLEQIKYFGFLQCAFFYLQNFCLSKMSHPIRRARRAESPRREDSCQSWTCRTAIESVRRKIGLKL